jgi:tRNA modification GTPase
MACWESATKLSLSINAIRYGTWRGANRFTDCASNENAPSIGLVRTQGESEVALGESLPRPASPNWNGDGPHPTSSAGGTAPEDIVVCQTALQTVELHCHGGKMAAERIVQDLVALGAVPRYAIGSEVHHSSLTLSSFDSEKIGDFHDVAKKKESISFTADAWEDLLKTTTPLTTAMMLDQAHGALDRAVQEIQDAIAASQFEQANRNIDRLCSRYAGGLHLTQPWKLAITGPPNVGKSSLLNAILGFSRAIVDPLAGTTRDILNERTSLLGWPFEILDTAGLRETHDTIEAEGVRRTMVSIKESDIALCLVDPTVGWSDLHEELRQRFENKLLFLVSKADLISDAPLSTRVVDAIRVSSRTKIGIQELYEAIVRRLIPESIKPGTAIPFRNEHVAYLERLRASIQ